MSAIGRTRIYVGYPPAIQGSAAIRLSRILAELEIDCTVYKAVGRFTGDDGIPVNERTFVIEIIGDSGSDDWKTQVLAHKLKHSEGYEQDEVWITKDMVDLVVV